MLLKRPFETLCFFGRFLSKVRGNVYGLLRRYVVEEVGSRRVKVFRNPSRDCGKEISSCLTTHRQRLQDVFAQEAPDKAQGFKRPFQKHQPKRAVDNGLSLEPAERAGLAVNMAEALSLLAVLQQTCGSHNQNNINTNYAKDSGENVVDKNVGKGRDRRRTPSLEGRSCRARTHGIRPEERRRAVEITTAVELDVGSKSAHTSSY